MATLSEQLEARTRDGDVYERLPNGWVRCHACGHDCPIPPGKAGVCKVRYNEATPKKGSPPHAGSLPHAAGDGAPGQLAVEEALLGTLKVPWGYVAGVQCDPIEKKPFFHAWPGTMAYSFGMLGCDLHCAYCQNWVTSQALRDPSALAPPRDVDPAELARDARRRGARAVVSTYNEPLITVEWGVAVFREARALGLATGFVSNGNGTPQVLDYLTPWIDLYKIDLKSFDDKQYRKLGGRLQPILDTIRALHARGVWIEIVTLLVPGFNDSEAELAALTAFVAGVSPEIPWHVTAFHQDYKMTSPADTTAADLLRAAAIGRRAGLRYVYAGNLPGRVADLEDTRCPSCARRLIERTGFRVTADRLTGSGRCACGAAIPGRWQ